MTTVKLQFKICGVGISIGIVGLLLAATVALAETGDTDMLRRSTRNPFALPKGVYYKSDKKPTQTTQEKILTKDAQKQVVQLPPLSLQAVILGGPRRVAVINNRNFVVGEYIFDHELVEIGRDQVVLMGKTGTLTLYLDTSPFGLKVSGP